MSYDRKSYARGWAASVRSSDGALDRADARREPSEWYDGYLDFAADRPKGFSITHTAEQREAYDRGEDVDAEQPAARATVELDGRTWTYYSSAAAAPGTRAGWYDADDVRATASLAQWLAELFQRTR